MAAFEMPGPRGREYVELEGDRVTVGRSTDNDLVLSDDSSVSRHHAVLEQFGTGWFIRDLNSANGTEVNGARVVGERPLRNGDVVVVGETRLVFHARAVSPDTSTDKKGPKPRLTVKERETLVELCRPILTSHTFKDAASVKEIAERMFVGEAAVKAHLSRLYDKFDISDDVPNRRRELASRAIDSGSTTLRDLEAHDAQRV